ARSRRSVGRDRSSATNCARVSTREPAAGGGRPTGVTDRTAPLRIAAVAVLSLTALAACGRQGAPVGSGDPVAAPATPPVGGPVAVVEVVENVEYYPACANSSYVVDDTTWYPVVEWADPALA